MSKFSMTDKNAPYNNGMTAKQYTSHAYSRDITAFWPKICILATRFVADGVAPDVI